MAKNTIGYVGHPTISALEMKGKSHQAVLLNYSFPGKDTVERIKDFIPISR